ncbi:TRAP transporter substrate-binding protein [Pseudorhodoferax sp.]|uniref:TRAP transporter substrate-binding protein n=1 Tax=Pseudorhodoferax sp. TaxID=1993553 RepID=UPI002DD61A73|nr:TRAP transporter substrate-binding protein [Pseudorhodoferax sp.]
MNRRPLLSALLLAAGLALNLGAAQAQNKAVIKLGWTTSDGAQDPYAVGARAFKSAVERDTKGAVEVQLFPNRALGDERQMLEGMRFGTVDAGVITNAVIAQMEPAFSLNDLPFLYGSEAQAHKVLDGAVGQELAGKLAAKGIVVLGFMEGGFRNMINNKRPVSTPDDVKGVKYRVMQNPVYIGMFNSLGGSAVPMAWGETFTAVQQGTIDGLEIPLAVIEANKYYEVTKFLSLTNHTYSVNALVISRRALDRLSPEQRNAVTAAARSATAQQRQVAAADAEKTLGALEKQGMKVNRIAAVADFRKNVTPVYDKFRQDGHGALLDKALAAVK